MTIILGGPAAQPAPLAPTPTTPDPVDVALAAALTRNLATTSCPNYLRDAATAWLARPEGPTP